MKACLFDIDGTLIQTGGAGVIAFGEAFDELFGVAELSRDVSFAGRSDRGICQSFFDAHGVENTVENWGRFVACYTRRLAEQLPRCDGEVLPGVGGLIERLRALGDVHIGLLTGNVRRGAELKLGHYGLWGHFAFGGFGDEHPDRNDIAASAVAEARAAHGASAKNERVVVIGDTPNDVRCARSVGAYAVAVPTGGATAEELATSEPDLIVPTLGEHEEIVAFLAG